MPLPTAFGRILVAWRFACPTSWSVCDVVTSPTSATGNDVIGDGEDLSSSPNHVILRTRCHGNALMDQRRSLSLPRDDDIIVKSRATSRHSVTFPAAAITTGWARKCYNFNERFARPHVDGNTDNVLK